MDKYMEMVRIRFLMMLAYRTNYYTGILIYAINIAAYYFLWSAIYGGKSSMQGMSLGQMTTYVAISWLARAFYFNNLDREIAMEIRDGKVAVELIRPYSYLGMKLCKGLAKGCFAFSFYRCLGFFSYRFFCRFSFRDTPKRGCLSACRFYLALSFFRS
ncbi:hypothetical protein LR69_02974 [Geobacillus sp. BCO2]|nr:hypothetical protein LR69_02974 [Geobacillus sp. BCO2]